MNTITAGDDRYGVLARCGHIVHVKKSDIHTTIAHLRVCDKCGAILESLPWDCINDVPLDAWFRLTVCKSQQIFRIQMIHYGYLVFLDTSPQTHRELLDNYEWTMTPKDESSWKPCNKRYTAERCGLT